MSDVEPTPNDSESPIISESSPKETANQVPQVRLTESRGLLRLFMRWLIRRYYPCIEISGEERIPQTGPVLLCANHPNSLVDPVIIGIATKRPVRFMAKAPLFEMPVIGGVMRALGMIPAYRGSDDSKQVRRNMESLNVGAKALVEGSAMGIFPEGKSTDEAHVDMVRSGAARMTLRAVEEGAVGLQVVPIGINYEHKAQSRTSIWIQVGEPIDANQILAQHDGNVRKARRSLTAELESRLKDVVVHLDEPQWEAWLDDLETLVPDDSKKSTGRVRAIKRRKRIANAMNHFLSTDRPRTERVADAIAKYRNDVAAAELSVDSAILNKRGPVVALLIVWKFLCLVRFFVPAVLGTLHHIVPFVVVRGLTEKFDEPGYRAKSTLRIAFGLPIYLLWYTAVAYWMFGYFQAWVAWTWLVVAPIVGVIALYSWRLMGETAALVWHQLRFSFNRGALNSLRRQRLRLAETLTQLSREYAALVPREDEPSHRIGRWLAIAGGTVLLVAALALFAWLLKPWLLSEPLPSGLDLANIPATKIDAMLTSDEKSLLPIMNGLDELEVDAKALRQEFNDGKRTYKNAADNDAVHELMRRYIIYREALLRLVWKYQGYGQVENEHRRLRVFLIDLTAAAVLYEAGLKFIRGFDWKGEAKKKLNEQEPHWGIPANLFDQVEHSLLNPDNNRMFRAALKSYHAAEKKFEANGLTDEPHEKRLHAAIDRFERTAERLGENLITGLAERRIKDAGVLLKKAQYETQSTISTWIGDFKIREPRLGQALISEQHRAQLAEILQPGDIILERRNWYLSNAFLPGFWPHGAVYVGTVDDIRKLGIADNEYVRKYWDEYSRLDHAGHAHVIIEAVSEGVVFSSLEHSIGEADAVAVLRPKVSDAEKAKAVARAFSFIGRDYDFEFDFETPSKLVCTEVVYRAWGGNSGPITFPLEQIMGRTTMPAINLVKKFKNEFGKDDAELEFIAFVDSNEITGKSFFVRDSKEFSATLDRSGFTLQGPTQAIKSIGPLGWMLLGLIAVCSVAGIVWSIRSHQRRQV
ncbi:MAG: 1-acyl-sn-glycerol-3-phosphate acyltransferase [Planctomycetota bacterium]|nr:1-acyl-sn-glycerol-3-phosphate acyltransferase [Planctomycetota bacterium]